MEAKPQVATVQFPVVTKEELRAFVQEVVVEARELVIDSDDMYEIAGELLTKVMGRKKALAAQLESITRPAQEIEANARALFRPAQTDVAAVEAILKNGMKGWLLKKQEDERIARQKAAQAAALEQARLDAEAEAARKAAEEAEGTPEAEEAQMVAQEAAEAAAMPVMPAMTLPTRAKAAGVSGRKKWVADVLNEDALFEFCAKPENKAWRSIYELKQGPLNKKAQALGLALKLPGVVVREDVTIAAKAA